MEKNIKKLFREAEDNDEDKNVSIALMFAIAVFHGMGDVVSALLNEGAKVNDKYDNGMTALMIVAKKGHSSISLDLLDKGAKINARDIYGRTALMIACKNGHYRVAEELITNDAFINAKDYTGRTAFGHAANNEIEELLIKAGAKK